MTDSAKHSPDDQLIAAYLEERLDLAATSAFEQRLASEPALSRRLAAHVLLDLDLRDLKGSVSSKYPTRISNASTESRSDHALVA